MPFFSVVIPTYNRRASLQKAIASVFCQDEQDFELIIVDDGSTDENQEFLKEIWQQNKMKALFSKKKGVSFARNLGVKNASSEWICFLDSDDLWHKQKLSRQKKFIQDTSCSVIFQTQEIWIRKGVRVNPPKKYYKRSGDIFSDCLRHCFITPSAVCLQKEVFLEVGGFDTHLPVCEDYDIWLRIAAKYPVGLIHQNLVTRFEGHQDQLSHTYPAMDRFRIYSLAKNIVRKEFSKEQTKSAYQVFQEKGKIYLQGAKKRAKNVDCFEKIYSSFCIDPIFLENFSLKDLRIALEID